jgi:nicotinamidase-related amidase
MATALLIVDVQRNMLEGEAPVPSAHAVKTALSALLTRARSSDALVVHVQNDGPPGEPDEPLTPGWELVFPARPEDLVVRKQHPDTFASNASLAEELRERDIDRVVIAGMQSDFCIAATSRGALRHGFGVVLAAGAHATYNGREPAATIAANVEAELLREGVHVLHADAIKFG